MTLYIEKVEGPAQTVLEWINIRVAETGARSYLVAQTITAAAFVKYDGGQLPGIVGTMAGRIFGEDAEIRWIQDGARYRAWWLSEKDPEREGAKELECRPGEYAKKYYCFGVFDAGTQVFSEKRLSKTRTYPVTAAADDRAYVEVVEYHPAEPAAGAGLEAIVRHLNQPGIVAYRFVSVDAWQDPIPLRGQPNAG